MSIATPVPAQRQQINPVGAALAGLGAGMAIISIFLPVVQNPGFALGIQDNSLIQSTGAGTGIAVRYVVCAIIIAGLTYRYYRNGRANWGILIPAAILGGGAVVDMNTSELFEVYSYDPLSNSVDYGSGSIDGNPAIAMYLAAAGGALAFIGGLMMWRSPATVAARPGATSLPTAVGPAWGPTAGAPVAGDAVGAAEPEAWRPPEGTPAATDAPPGDDADDGNTGLWAAPAGAPVATDAPPAADAVDEQLRKLEDLHRAGVLTDDELAAKTRQITGDPDPANHNAPPPA